MAAKKKVKVVKKSPKSKPAQKKKTAKKAAPKKQAAKKAAAPKKLAAKKTAPKAKSLVKTKSLAPAKTAANRNRTATATESGLLPSRDGVLVERVIESDRTPGGLYIPAAAMEKPVKGVVIRAGKGKFSKRGKLRPLDVQPGDEVLFGKFAGTEIKIDGKEYLLIREDEILGVVS